MVQLDVPAAFAASMFFLDIGRKAVKKAAEGGGHEASATYYRFLFRSVLFAGAVIAPAGTYLLAGWPGWEQIYWSRRFEEVMHTGWVNALLPALFVLAIVLAAYFGHILAYRWLASGREKYVRPMWVGVLLVFCVIVLLNYPSFLLVGTYDQYHNLYGEGRESMAPPWQNPYGFGTGWVGVMIYFVIPLAYLAITIRRESRQS